MLLKMRSCFDDYFADTRGWPAARPYFSETESRNVLQNSGLESQY